MTTRLSLANIERAAREVDPAFLHSPSREVRALSQSLGMRVVIKDETQNPIRSFKGRGTDFFLKSLANRPPHVVCASAGNFGQGLAWAARSLGVACTVFAAETANPLKVERMRSFGATVRLAGQDFDAAKETARAWAAREGHRYVEDGREPAIAEGAGSIAVELLACPEPFRMVVIPLGNGALLSGMATWIKSVSPGTRVIGVCAANAPSMERSWHEHRVATTASANTIADGIAVRVPIPEALEDLVGVVDDVVLVSEHSLRAAVRTIHETANIVVEPAGAAGLAALIEHPERLNDGVVGTVLCGGNITPAQLSDILQRAGE